MLGDSSPALLDRCVARARPVSLAPRICSLEHALLHVHGPAPLARESHVAVEHRENHLLAALPIAASVRRRQPIDGLHGLLEH
eukprot:1629831-Pyramimonas_sp.AAC.1